MMVVVKGTKRAGTTFNQGNEVIGILKIPKKQRGKEDIVEFLIKTARCG
jgi:hypothetical protein